MKKILISVSAAIALIGAAAVSYAVIERNSDDILGRNVEALMEQETHAYGQCDRQHKTCMGICGDCGELVYAEGYYGNGYNIHH